MIILTGANNINQNFWYNFRFENNSLVSDFDRSHFVSALDQAPNVSSRIPSNVILEIPTYNNTNKTFRYFETDVMPLSLKMRYPMFFEIKET